MGRREDDPGRLRGCVRDGETVEANAKPCGDGPEEFVQYQYVEDEITYPFVAILGEKVIEYVDDENAPYAKLFDKCDGEPVNSSSGQLTDGSTGARRCTGKESARSSKKQSGLTVCVRTLMLGR